MRKFKAIIGVYGKNNNLIGCYEDIISALTTTQASKLAKETCKFLQEQHQRRVKLLSLRIVFEQEQVSTLPF